MFQGDWAYEIKAIVAGVVRRQGGSPLTPCGTARKEDGSALGKTLPAAGPSECTDQRHSNREKLNYGLALLRAGKSADGFARLKYVQQRDPKLPHTWFNLGIYYKRSGDTRNAIAQYQTSRNATANRILTSDQIGEFLKPPGN